MGVRRVNLNAFVCVCVCEKGSVNQTAFGVVSQLLHKQRHRKQFREFKSSMWLHIRNILNYPQQANLSRKLVSRTCLVWKYVATGKPCGTNFLLISSIALGPCIHNPVHASAATFINHQVTLGFPFPHSPSLPFYSLYKVFHFLKLPPNCG